MFGKKRRNIIVCTCQPEKPEALYLPINVRSTGFKTVRRIMKMRVRDWLVFKFCLMAELTDYQESQTNTKYHHFSKPLHEKDGTLEVY